jgi:hypothetical protein
MRAAAPLQDRSENPPPDSLGGVINCRPNRSLGGDLGTGVTRENVYYLIIGVLAIVFAAITYHVYREHKLPEGARFHLGPNGLSIERK